MKEIYGDYVLISFYNRCTIENPSWEVYGHKGPHNNKMLMAFITESQAIEYAHTFYATPVIKGTGAIIDEYIKRLVGK